MVQSLSAWLGDARLYDSLFALMIAGFTYFSARINKKVERIGEHVEQTREQVTNNHTVNFREEMTEMNESLKASIEEIRREAAKRDALADERANCLMTQMNEINRRLNSFIYDGVDNRRKEKR
jgi:predicted Holliday junction resolvase-like endonuclease